MKRDESTLADLRSFAEEIASLMHGVALMDFLSNREKCRAVERLLELIGEAAWRLDPGTREGFEVDWNAIRGLRNLLAHQYHRVDYRLLYRIATQQVPALQTALGR